jgi:hypothetical protein
MALINCPECRREISDKAFMCPHCGAPRPENLPQALAGGLGYRVPLKIGREYRSKTEILGLPLLHIATGFDLETGRMRVAKGIIAIGNIALGVLAFGGVSAGLISFGGLALGLCALGGVAIGLLSFGGCAIGILLAVGGGAVGLVAIGGGAFGYYAMGGGAGGVHVIDAARQDPEAVAFFTQWFGQWILPPFLRPPTP